MKAYTLTGLLVVAFSQYSDSQAVADDGDFKSFLNSSSYFDKSSFLAAITTKRKFKVFLAPPKFGKTINLQMVDMFMSLPLDVYGNWNQTLYDERHKAFQALKILKRKPSVRKMMSHFCSKPVLNIDLKVKGKITCKREAQKRIMFKTHSAYKKYSYVCRSTNITRGEQEVCKQWGNATMFRKFPERDVLRGLNRLLYYMRQYFNKDVILLVDNHDDLIDNALLHTNETEFNKTISFTLQFFENVLTSNDISHAVIMGMRYVADKAMCKVFPIQFLGLHKRYSCFGLSSTDLNRLLKPITRAYRIRFFEWYDAYYNVKGVRIYNMYSIVLYKNTQVHDYYWINSSRVDLKPFFEIDFILKTCKHLLNRGFVVFDIIETHTSADLINLKRIIDGSSRLTSCDRYTHNLVLTFFFNRGYLSYSESNATHMQLVNKEVRDEFSRQIGIFYSEMYGSDIDFVKKCAGFFNRIEKTYQKSGKKLEFKNFYALLHTLLLDYDVRMNNATSVDRTFMKNVIFAVASQAHGWSIFTDIYDKTLNITEDQKVDFFIVKSSFGIILDLEHKEHEKPNGTLLLNRMYERDYRGLFQSRLYTRRNIVRYILFGLSINYKVELSCSMMYRNKGKEDVFEESVKIII